MNVFSFKNEMMGSYSDSSTNFTSHLSRRAFDIQIVF